MFDEQQQQQQHQAYAAYGFVPLPFDHFGLFEPAPSFVEPPPSPSIFADMTPIGLSATSSHLSPPAPDLEFDLGLDLGFGSGAALFAESWRALDPFPAAQHEPPPPPPQQQQQNRRSAEQGDANLQQEVVGISFSSSSTVSPLVEKASPGTFDQLDGFASWIQSFESHAPNASDLPLILSSSTASGSAVSPRDIFWADAGGGPSTDLVAPLDDVGSTTKREVELTLLSSQHSPTPALLSNVGFAFSPEWLAPTSIELKPLPPRLDEATPSLAFFASPEPDDRGLDLNSLPRGSARKRSAASTGIELDAGIAPSASIAPPPSTRPAAKRAKMVPAAQPKPKPKPKTKPAVARQRKVSFDESMTGGSDDDDDDDDSGDAEEPPIKTGKLDKSQLTKKERRKATNRASAAAFRNRRKNLVVDLQKQIDERAEEIRQLQVAVLDLRSRNQALKATKESICSF